MAGDVEEGRFWLLPARLFRSPLARRFISGASWSIAGSVLSQGITLLTLVLVVRLLGKETYGQFVLIQSTLNMVGVFAGFGIGQTATRYIAALKLRDTRRLGHILALSQRTVFFFGAIMTGALALFSPQLASGVLNTPALAAPLSIAAFTVFFATLDGYQKSVLIGMEAMRTLANATVLGVAISAPVMLLAVHSYGLTGAAIGLVAGTMIQAGISLYLASREMKRFGIKPEPRECLREWPVLRDFALPALLAGALVAPAHWICQAMLANTPGGHAEIALLGVAMQWFSAILFLPSVAGRVVMPMLTDYIAAENHADSKRLLVLAVKANALVALLPAATIALLSPWLLSLYGPDFQNGSMVLIIAVFTAALLAAQVPVGNMLAAVSRMWLGLLMNLGWAAIYIGVAFLLLEHGATGVITGLGLAYLAHAIWTFSFATYQLRSRGHT
jgi:O-antigen/teichoic acid export membrane protein